MPRSASTRCWAAYRGFLLRPPPPAIQDASQLHSIVAVHGQQFYRGTTGSSQSNNARFIKLEVIVPSVSPRVVQFCNRSGLRINRRDVGSFFQVAPNAAQAKVARVVRPTVLSTDNVIDLMGKNQRRTLAAGSIRRLPSHALEQTYVLQLGSSRGGIPDKSSA